MAEVRNINETFGQMAQTTKNSYQVVLDHGVALQERNIRFSQGMLDSAAKELRQQAESNRAMTQEFVEKAEKQREAFQSLVEDSVDSYTNFVYAPFAYYKEGLEAVKKAAR